VEALGTVADPYTSDLINDMFGSGLSEDLLHCLHSVAVHVPSQQSVTEDRLLQEVSLCLAGTPSANAICDPLSSFVDEEDEVIDIPRIQINMSDKTDAVEKIVLSLRTLGSFEDSSGTVTTSIGVVPLLPFVRDVAARYLAHPSSEVRRETALTCCSLLVVRDIHTAVPSSSIVVKKSISPRTALVQHLGSESGRVTEEVLGKLLRVAVSDPSPIVRLCGVRALDSRFDAFLCQAHHLQAICLVLQDEALATRAAALKLLGRLARQNSAIVLPVMRRFLVDLIIELRCGGDTGRSREEATRLLRVFLRSDYLHRLVQPVLPSIVEALPLRGVPPRLASAALEAMGELAQASRSALRPWVPKLIPHILETMQDQSSTSKQRTSLKTLGQIAGSTGYVISPYLGYPQLLSQATDVLPGTKRAPWVLRREVIRTLGMLGALDPDYYHASVPKTRKGGAVGGGYYIEQDSSSDASAAEVAGKNAVLTGAKSGLDVGGAAGTGEGNLVLLERDKRKASGSVLEPGRPVKQVDNDGPVHLYMYEQYAISRMLPWHRSDALCRPTKISTLKSQFKH
jgi:FKBP12-rapamycin complex-associated protein